LFYKKIKIIPFWKKKRKIVNEFWLDFSQANWNVGQSRFLTVLHLINSPPIYFEARHGHRSNRQVEPSFKTIAFQMQCFQFSQYLGSWVWKVYMGWYRFLFRLHPLKLFILKKELRLSRWPRFLLSFFIIILPFKI